MIYMYIYIILWIIAIHSYRIYRSDKIRMCYNYNVLFCSTAALSSLSSEIIFRRELSYLSCAKGPCVCVRFESLNVRIKNTVTVCNMQKSLKIITVCSSRMFYYLFYYFLFKRYIIF